MTEQKRIRLLANRIQPGEKGSDMVIIAEGAQIKKTEPFSYGYNPENSAEIDLRGLYVLPTGADADTLARLRAVWDAGGFERVFAKTGSVEPGTSADLVAFDDDFNIRFVMTGGRPKTQ